MPFTTYLDNALLNEVLGGKNYTPPTNLYVALSTTAPNKNGGNVTEPSGGGYARVQVANTADNFPDASSGQKKNGATITFPEATGNWGTVTHFVIYDAATGGNALMYGALTASKTIEAGDTASFDINALTISIS